MGEAENCPNKAVHPGAAFYIFKDSALVRSPCPRTGLMKAMAVRVRIPIDRKAHVKGMSANSIVAVLAVCLFGTCHEADCL